MFTVYAFQPDPNEPPQFVTELGDFPSLSELRFIAGPQCDSCGNTRYVFSAPPQSGDWHAACSDCSALYQIALFHEDGVVFPA